MFGYRSLISSNNAFFKSLKSSDTKYLDIKNIDVCALTFDLNYLAQWIKT